MCHVNLLFWSDYANSHWLRKCWFRTRIRKKWGRTLMCWTSQEFPGYFSINLAKNRSTLIARREVIPSTSAGTTGGNHSRERHVSAKPLRNVHSAPLYAIFHSSRFPQFNSIQFNSIQYTSLLCKDNLIFFVCNYPILCYFDPYWFWSNTTMESYYLDHRLKTLWLSYIVKPIKGPIIFLCAPVSYLFGIFFPLLPTHSLSV